MNDRKISIELPHDFYEKNDFLSTEEFIEYIKSFKCGLNPKNDVLRIKLKEAKTQLM